MSNVLLNLNGVASGTGAYNPVPSSFTANPSVMKLIAIVGTSVKPLAIIPNLASVWNSTPAILSATGTNLNFVETLNANLPASSGDSLIRFIGNPAQPGLAPSGTLFTGLTSATGTFSILANNNG